MKKYWVVVLVMVLVLVGCSGESEDSILDTVSQVKESAEDAVGNMDISELEDAMAELEEVATEMESALDGEGLADIEAEQSGPLQDAAAMGDVVDSEQLSVQLHSATIQPCDKEGLEILTMDVTVTNHTSEIQYFMLGLNLDGVFTSDGESLECAVNDYDFSADVPENVEKHGVLAFYVEEGQQDFYMRFAPDLNHFSDRRDIAFTATPVGGEVAIVEDSQEASGVSVEVSGEGIFKATRPEKMRLRYEMTASSMTMTGTTYYDGDRIRTETDIPGMAKSIAIHLQAEDAIYSYVYGETTGTKLVGATSEYAEDMGIMIDSAAVMTEAINNSGQNIHAQKATLDGEEVLYIESSESDEEMGDVMVKMWYSEKYATPLKYEVYMGDQLMMSMKVTEITDNVQMHEDLFTVPEDVEFYEMTVDM